MPPNATTASTTKSARNRQEGEQSLVMSNQINKSVIISGVSVRFPESDSVSEFQENLYDGVDMITEDERRWPLGLYGLPGRSGKIKDLSKFDAQFFAISQQEAKLMDPQTRLMLETTFEAIVDAGLIPSDVSGKRTGVFFASFFNEIDGGISTKESQEFIAYRQHLSRHINFAFDITGPSPSFDTACSSSFSALNEAFIYLKTGQLDYAILVGCNVAVWPARCLQFDKMSFLSREGKCAYLDESGNGYVKAEAVSSLLLQTNDVKIGKNNTIMKPLRNYCEIVNIKTNADGFKKEGITFPAGDVQLKLLKEVYSESGVDALEVDYVEAHGTGTQAGDTQETQAIYDFYCKETGRKEPLLVGSVKSNMGHAEGISGLASIVKVIIAFETEKLPPNIHLNKINPKLTPVIEGYLKPVTEKTTFTGSLVGISSFGFGGANGHVILRKNQRKEEQKSNFIVNRMDRLILVPGTSKEAVDAILDSCQSQWNNKQLSNSFLRILNQYSRLTPQHGMEYRGSLVIPLSSGSNNILVKRDVRKSPFSGETLEGKVFASTESVVKPKVVFLFSGLGCQARGMFKDLIKIDCFNQVMESASKILDPLLKMTRNTTLYEVLFSEDIIVEEDPLLAAVSLTVFQSSLMRVLNECGIKQDVVIGYSIGEFAAAYASGQISFESMLKIPVGICTATDREIKAGRMTTGSMAAVGLSAEQFVQKFSSSHARVAVSCFNCSDTVTVGGSEEDIDSVVEVLQSQSTFVRKVKSCGMSYHSPVMMDNARDSIKSSLDSILEDKTFSASNIKWISTTKREGHRIQSTQDLSIAEYFRDNITDSVLFEEACQDIPENSIIIEISPRAFLSSLMKKNVSSRKDNTLIMKSLSNNASLTSFLDLLTDVYVSGIPVDLDTLYDFTRSCPSSPPTAMPSLSSLIKWRHKESHLVRLYPDFFSLYRESNNCISIDINKPEFKYLRGHKIDGRVLFPASGFLFFAWQSFVKNRGRSVQDLDVDMTEVVISRACILSPDKPSRLTIAFHESKKSGVKFSIFDGETVFASGIISSWRESHKNQPLPFDNKLSETTNGFTLDSSDIYRELRIRGYEYGRSFRLLSQILIPSPNESMIHGVSEWKGQWISFTDSLLQLSALAPEYDGQRGLFLPTGIQFCKLSMSGLDEKNNLEISVSYEHSLKEVSSASGITLSGIQLTMMTKKTKTEEDTVEEYRFFAYDDKNVYAEGEVGDRFIYRPLLDTVIENSLDYGSEIKPFSVLVLDLSSSDNVSTIQMTHSIKELSKSLTTTPELAFSVALVSQNEHVLQEQAWPEDIERLHIQSIRDSKELAKKICHASLTVVFFSEDCQAGQCFLENIKEGNFILVVSPGDALDCLIPNGCAVISRKFQSETRFTLIRKLEWQVKERYPQEHVIVNVSSLSYSWVEEVKKTAARQEVQRIWLTINAVDQDFNNNTGDPNKKTKSEECSSTGILGLMNALRQEPGVVRDKIRCVFDSDALKTISGKEINRIQEQDLLMNIRVNGVWGSYRHVIMTPDIIEDLTRTETNCAFLNIKTIGDLSSFSWFKSRLENVIHKSCGSNGISGVVCSVNYAALNFKDVMLASGKLPISSVPSRMKDKSCVIGIEFSGTSLKSGERVMGFVESSAMASHVYVEDKDFLWSVPDEWSLEEASTVPCVYSTAYYALLIRGKLLRGESVLIHAGSGGVGQASISIALSLGCQVFTSVGTKEKKDFLQNKFPELQDDCFVDSRSTSFFDDIMIRTKGRGVDVVLNSLADDMMKYSIQCLAVNGRFLEIGKYDLTKNTLMEMSTSLSKNQSFHGIFLDELLAQEGKGQKLSKVVKQDKERLHKVIEDGIRSGVVRPLDTTVFSHEKVEQAFRFMASGKHIGKVVIKIRDEVKRGLPRNSISNLPEKPLEVSAVDKLFFSPIKSYVIIGGLGGFALELLHFMTLRGAKKILLTSRRGVTTSYQEYSIQRMNREIEGLTVIVSTLDASKISEAQEIINQAELMGKLGGVFNLAMVLSDALFDNQTVESFKTTCDGKVAATLNLDSLTRKSKNLDHFVCFSSISAGRGIAGQSNYAFANSFMERICEQRRAVGLPGLAVEWGAVGDVGVLARKTDMSCKTDLEDKEEEEKIEVRGTRPQRITNCLLWLEKFMLIQRNRKDGSAVFSSFTASKKNTSKTSKSSPSDGKSLLEKVAHIIGVRNIEEQMMTSPENTSLAQLGIDSLMAIEIKQTIERFLGEESGVSFNTQNINQMKVSQLIQFQADKNRK